ncbi:hypothetical protein ACG7TL_006131 [Trametes sanguinea]
MLATMGTDTAIPSSSHHSPPEDPASQPILHSFTAAPAPSTEDPMSVDEEGYQPRERANPEDKITARIMELAQVESRLHHRSRRVNRWTCLTFSTIPKTSTDEVAPLVPNIRENVEFESYRSWLCEEITHFGSSVLPIGNKDADHRRLRLLRWLESELRRLNGVEAHCWDRAKILARLPGFYLLPDEEGPVVIPPPPKPDARRNMQPFLVAALFMVCALHSLAHVARPYANLVLATIKVVIWGAIMACGGSSTLMVHQQSLLKLIPSDVRTAIDLLGLEPDLTVYAACPRCFSTYAPKSHSRDSRSSYPARCTHVETSNPPCDEPLLEGKDCCEARHKRKRGEAGAPTEGSPRTPFVYHSLSAWIAEMLSRLGLADLMAKGWEGSGSAPSGVWSDIMDAPTLRDFAGPDGHTLFSVQINGSVHLVFSLFIDWFNPYGNKQAGKKRSIGAIYMACLNLPPHLRYRPENIYLAGIIPGPCEPHLHQLNPLLQPLIDELLLLWNRGIYVSQVAGRETGCLVRAALIPLVCDLPALRQTAGFHHYQARRFCSFCALLKPDIYDLDRSNWPPACSWSEHLKAAEAWRDAPTDAERKRLLDTNGIRWSPLLELPYWDPTRFALIDAMHNLFLGVLHQHCMDIWGLKTAEGRHSEKPKRVQAAVHTLAMQQAVLDRLVEILHKGSLKTLSSIRKDYLEALVKYNPSISVDKPAPTRADYAKALLEWVARAPKGVDSLLIPPVLLYDTNNFSLKGGVGVKEPDPYENSVFSAKVLEAIRKDIAAVTLPSWLPRPPRNFGSATHGKLKADQWRTVCTVNMVITLVRLWSDAAATDNEKLALTNFLHLVSAVDLATRYTMSAARAERFNYHMLEYVRGIRPLYGAKLVPNHHLSLHLADILMLFGPTFAWWSFPFERYNGLLQKLNTSHKISEMPKTFMHYFYMGARIRWMISTDSKAWPDRPEFQELVRAFQNAFQDAAQGSRVIHTLSSGVDDNDTAFTGDRSAGVEETLDRRLYETLLDFVNSRLPLGTPHYASRYDPQPGTSPFLPSSATFLPSIPHAGVTISTSDTRYNTSFNTPAFKAA